MAEKLTPQQAQAVHDRGGRLLVSAAAGSGKTKVLVDRLLSYLMDPQDPANLDEFLIITYTKAAAAELRAKIASKLTEKIAEDPRNRHLQQQMQRLFLTKISTVHGFCGDLLREYAYRLDLPADFRVADENECRELQDGVLEELLNRAYEEAGEHPDFLSFVDTQGLGRDDRLVPELILKVYNAARCHLNPELWLQKCIDCSEGESWTDAGETVWGEFLMEEFFSCLDSCIRIFTQCVLDADGCEGFEKPADNLKTTLISLQELRNCASWDEIVKHRKIDYGRLTFSKKAGNPELAERIKAGRSACKDSLSKKLRWFANDSAQILGDLSQCAQATRGLIGLVREFSAEYDKMKKSRRILDFGDLEHRTLDLLLGKDRHSPTSASKEVSLRFCEILVDEYQDSNEVQDAIFTVLSEKDRNCFLVGDVKQSIYQFRLADPGIFLEKYNTYAMAEEAKPREGRKVLLNANFRSGPEVIEAVNAVFKTSMSPRVGGLAYTSQEELREGMPHGLLPDPAVELYAISVSQDSYQEEAAFIAGRIQEMLLTGTVVREVEGFRPVRPEDIVILLRSPNSVGKYYQMALEGLGIRCVSGGGTDLLGTQEVASFRSLLETIANPRQDIPLLSTVMSPIFGLTADDLAKIRSEKKKGPIYDAMVLSDHPKAVFFRETLGMLRQEARTCSLTELLQHCLSQTGLQRIYGAMPGGEAKTANLQTFYKLASDYEAGGIRDLSQFLDHLQALEDKGLLAASDGSAGAVTIMSIHKSKGLEFPVVFLSALSREFNSEDLKQRILTDKDLGLGLSVADQDNRVRYSSLARDAISAKTARESLSEEMRVLYVAMTRARDRLIMTCTFKNLTKTLSEMAHSLDFDGGSLQCQEAGCPAIWVLRAALLRTEAGELHNLGDRPMETKVSELPWKIRVVESDPETGEARLQNDRPAIAMPAQAEQELRQALSFVYGHEAATRAPSKQTATGRKDREKEKEAAEAAPEPKVFQRSWREPGFRSQKKQGKVYGTAVHAAMEYLDFSRCGREEGLEQELQRIKSSGLLTEDQGKLLNAETFRPFFETPLGKKLTEAKEVLKEFKFSILDDGSHYGDGLQGEQVLLQGVVDCALIEEDGITVLDFKTDYVQETTLSQAVDRYRLQLSTYAMAMERIYEKPVKESLLYFFHLNRFVKV